MIRLLLLTALVVLMAVPSVGLTSSELRAQSNDNDYTPLNSRIRRDRQFPTLPPEQIDRNRMSSVSRARSRDMVSQFGKCMWDRGNQKGLDLLAMTDFGFRSFEQIGMDYDDAKDVYPIQTCLGRVANSNRSGVHLTYNAESIRRWYLEAAYLDYWPDGPAWAAPGNVVAEREYPLSANYPTIRSAMDFADCVVSHDPVGTDFFYRTAESSDEENAALRAIVPSIGPCLPGGQQMEIEPFAMRVWLGEALWHAANNNSPVPAEASAPAETSQDSQ